MVVLIGALIPTRREREAEWKPTCEALQFPFRYGNYYLVLY